MRALPALYGSYAHASHNTKLIIVRFVNGMQDLHFFINLVLVAYERNTCYCTFVSFCFHLMNTIV